MKSFELNIAFLEGLDQNSEQYILRNVAYQYGMTTKEARKELIDPNAEELPEYVTGKLKMTVFEKYRDFEKGAKVDSLW
jgi:hypothetical protein